MGSLRCPYLFLIHHRMILFLMNPLFRFALQHRNRVDLVFLRKHVLISVIPSICCDFDLFLDVVLLVSHRVHVHLCGMWSHDVFPCRDFSNGFLTSGDAFLLCVLIFLTYYFAVNANVFFYLYRGLFFRGDHATVTGIDVFLSVMENIQSRYDFRKLFMIFKSFYMHFFFYYTKTLKRAQIQLTLASKEKAFYNMFYININTA